MDLNCSLSSVPQYIMDNIIIVCHGKLDHILFHHDVSLSTFGQLEKVHQAELRLCNIYVAETSFITSTNVCKVRCCMEAKWCHNSKEHAL